jgi:hypothetical protein
MMRRLAVALFAVQFTSLAWPLLGIARLWHDRHTLPAQRHAVHAALTQETT